MANSIVHFEIPADDVARAKDFYERAFGWSINDPWKMEYFLVQTRGEGEPGINGGLMQRRSSEQPFMNYIAVVSIDAACAAVEAAGGTIVVARTEIGSDMGWIAAFKDTEGNLMGLHEPPPRLQSERTPAGRDSARKKTGAKKRTMERSAAAASAARTAKTARSKNSKRAKKAGKRQVKKPAGKRPTGSRQRKKSRRR